MNGGNLLPRASVIKNLVGSWEFLLVMLFIIVNIINASISEYYLNFKLLSFATATFMDKALIVLPMVLVIIMGEIDISPASTLVLSSVLMGGAYQSGIPMPIAMVIAVLVASLCGFINGLLVVKFKELSSVIITLSTMIIFRGITYVMLEDQAIGNFPEWFTVLGWHNVGIFPVSLIIFLVFALVFCFLLHKTTLGRRIYAIGGNVTASLYSGVRVDRVKILVFTLTGFMTGLAALILTSRLGSTRPNIALAYELDVITIVVLGGISTVGGKGNMFGAIISIFLIGYLRYGLGLVNINSQILLIIIGSLLVLAVMVPNIRIMKYFRRKSNRARSLP